MRNALVIMLISLLIVNANAQENPNVDTFKNSLGLQAGFGFNDRQDDGLIGVQYKRWVRPNRALRLSAMYGRWNNFTNKEFNRRSGDTVFSNRYDESIDMFYLNVGIEMHKHFYKNVYLYAAIDLRGGYGTGTGNGTTEALIYNGPTPATEPIAEYSIGPSYNMSRFIIDSSPFVGVKFMFRRIAFGTEISAIYCGLESQTSNNVTTSTFNMDAGFLRQRMFVNFRF